MFIYSTKIFFPSSLFHSVCLLETLEYLEGEKFKKKGFEHSATPSGQFVHYTKPLFPLPIVIACLRCAVSPLRKCLVQQGCITSDEKMPRGGVSRMSSKLPTFEDVVLVRSLSEHDKKIVKK